MKKVVSLILVVLMIACVSVACGKTDAGETKPAEQQTTQSNQAGKTEAKPADSKPTEDKPAGSVSGRTDVNLNILADFVSTDAHGNRTVAELTWKTQVYEALYHFNENTLEFEPRLAKTYTVSDDKTTYTFDLRDDVYFHNGEKMKASDVVFSYNHIRNSATWKNFWSCVESIEATGEYQVAIHTTGIVAAAMSNFAQIWIMSEKEVTAGGEAFGTVPCKAGTGAYMITEFSNQHVTLEAFPQYYRGEARIKKINYSVIKDSSAGLIAFQAGELDWYTAPVADWDYLVNCGLYNTEVVAANHISYLFINYAANEVLMNDKVRQAIAYAIDKEAVNLAVFNGLGKVADYMENPDYNVAAPRADVVYDYNPEKAKQLLAEAGYPDGVYAGVLLCTSSSYFPSIATIVQDCLKAVGITVDLELGDSASTTPRFRTQDYMLGMTGYSNTGDFDAFKMRVASSSVGSYFVKYEGDKFDYKHFDDLFDQQAKELDLEKRTAINKQLVNEVMETACLIPIVHKAVPDVWNKNLHVVNAPNYYEVYDWYWD